MSTEKTPKMWRAQAKLIARGSTAALVEIPAMEGGGRYPVPWSVVPYGVELGERFYLRCTLSHGDFRVEPIRPD